MEMALERPYTGGDADSTLCPTRDAPDLARSSTSLLAELDPVNGDNAWDTFG
jgi:hypothetical protein